MKIIQLFVWTLFSVALCAQSNNSLSIPQTVRKGIIYKSEWAINGALHTNGFYFGYDKGILKNYHTTTYLHFDIGFLFNPRETRSSKSGSGGLNNSFNSFTFGKQNQLINLRVGKGIILTLSEKARTKGIAVGLKLEGGFDLGLLKPYYLRLSGGHEGSYYVERKYSVGDTNFLNPDKIIGASSFFKGFGELSVVPGIFGRMAFRFDPGAFEKMVRCIEVGIQVDLYSKRPAILIINDNPYSYINLYLNLQLGSRKS